MSEPHEPPRPFTPPDTSGPVSVYVHWPFCVSKCPYCDFNSHVRDRIDEKRFFNAYLKELERYAPLLSLRGVHTIFFGGGTPSLMPPDLTAALIDRMRPWFVDPLTEITLEANPSSAESAKLRAFKEAGVNRLSLGIQSLKDDALRFLGRAHDAKEARLALQTARELFDDRFSFDLIYARPGQTPKDWETELREALPLRGGHMSLYQLTIERGTPFFNEEREGRLILPEPDAAGDMYEITRALTEEAGLPRYEISNHAAPGQASRHNLQYWRYLDYVGVGAGACGRHVPADGRRVAVMNRNVPEQWLEAVETEGIGTQSVTPVPQEEAIKETIMTGLRLEEGLLLARLRETGGDAAPERLMQVAEPLIAEGLAKCDEKKERFACTRKGFPLADGVIRYILDKMKKRISHS